MTTLTPPADLAPTVWKVLHLVTAFLPDAPLPDAFLHELLFSTLPTAAPRTAALHWLAGTGLLVPGTAPATTRVSPAVRPLVAAHAFVPRHHRNTATMLLLVSTAWLLGALEHEMPPAAITLLLPHACTIADTALATHAARATLLVVPLGQVLLQRGETAQAEHYLRAALDQYAAAGIPGDERLFEAHSLQALGDLRQQRGDRRGAVPRAGPGPLHRTPRPRRPAHTGHEAVAGPRACHAPVVRHLNGGTVRREPLTRYDRTVPTRQHAARERCAT